MKISSTPPTFGARHYLFMRAGEGDCKRRLTLDISHAVAAARPSIILQTQKIKDHDAQAKKMKEYSKALGQIKPVAIGKSKKGKKSKKGELFFINTNNVKNKVLREIFDTFFAKEIAMERKYVRDAVIVPKIGGRDITNRSMAKLFKVKYLKPKKRK